MVGVIPVHTTVFSSFAGVGTISVGTSRASSSFSGLEGHVYESSERRVVSDNEPWMTQFAATHALVDPSIPIFTLPSEAITVSCVDMVARRELISLHNTFISSKRVSNADSSTTSNIEA